MTTGVGFDPGKKSTDSTMPTGGRSFLGWLSGIYHLFSGGTAKVSITDVTGEATNGLDVDVTRVQGSVAVTGTFWQATQPVSGTVTATDSSPGVDRTASGTLNGGTTTLDIDTAGCATVSIKLATTALTATIELWGIMQDGSATVVYGYYPGQTPTTSIVCSTDTATRRYLIFCGGFTYIRVYVHSHVTGSVNAYMVASKAPNISGLLDTTTGAIKTVPPADPFGTNADSASATGSISAKLRYIASTGIPVTGTFWQATQPVSIAGTVTVDSELPTAAALSDSTSNPTAPTVGAASLLYNGSTWERERGTIDGIALASAARTATTYSDTIVNYSCSGVIITWDMTVNAGHNVKLRVQYQDPASGKWQYIHADFGNYSTTGTRTYVIAPSATTSADIVQATSQFLPRTWRIEMTHATANSITYSVGYCMMR